jgi:gliding motility-associated-like protein
VYYPNVVLLNDNNCSFSYHNIDTVIVDELTAAFTPSVSAGCLPLAVNAVENSTGDVTDWTWLVGSNTYSGRSFPQQTFSTAGNHAIKLTVENPRGCLDSITKVITVHPLPVVAITGDTLLCQNDPEQLSATPDSDYSYQWIPTSGLDDPTSQSPTATLNVAVTYRVVATDENGCVDTSNAHTVKVHPELEAFAEPDTTIIMGDTAQIRTLLSQPVSSYQWSPAASLTCADCPNPGAFPVDRTTYTLIVKDSVGCDEKTVTVEINVIDDIRITMPDAFTPNGDDVNDLIYVRGWNIKELIYFRIYNRWGELIFETEDLQKGWDGTYKGEPQNMDSYAYVVKGVSFKDREGTARGSFSLIR